MEQPTQDVKQTFLSTSKDTPPQNYGSTSDVIKKAPLDNFELRQRQKKDGDAIDIESGKVKKERPKKKKVDAAALEPRLYWKRWFMLGMFCFLCIVNMYQWIHLNIIGNIVMKYYKPSLSSNVHLRNMSIDWLSMNYMICFIVLIIPSDIILVRKGLKWGCVLGAFFNALGAWLKCAAISPDRFSLVMIGQVMCGVSGCFVPNVIPYLSAVWFGPNEVSTATALGVISFQLGSALGFLIPPIIVPNSDDIEVIGHGFTVLYYTTSAVATLVLVLVALFFQKTPPSPPSRAQQLALQIGKHESYWVAMIKFMKNGNFMLFFVPFGINFGIFYALGTLLNPMFLEFYPGQETSAGRIGLTMVVTGILGVLLVGPWLDRTKTFKATCVVLNLLCTASILAFAFTLPVHSLWVVYVTIGLLGMFMTSNIPVGFEIGSEITYPDSEATSSAFLNTSSCIFCIIFVLALRPVMETAGVIIANVVFAASLFLAFILSLIVKADYRRQKSEKEAVEQEIEVEYTDEDLDMESTSQAQQENIVETEETLQEEQKIVYEFETKSQVELMIVYEIESILEAPQEDAYSTESTPHDQQEDANQIEPTLQDRQEDSKKTESTLQDQQGDAN